MSYSACDFMDDTVNAMTRHGFITQQQAEGDQLDVGNAVDAALSGIHTLLEQIAGGHINGAEAQRHAQHWIGRK